MANKDKASQSPSAGKSKGGAAASAVTPSAASATTQELSELPLCQLSLQQLSDMGILDTEVNKQTAGIIIKVQLSPDDIKALADALVVSFQASQRDPDE